MAKRFLMALIALSLATAAFAAGQNEKAPYGPLQGDKLVLKGTVSLQDFPRVTLKSGDKQYLLMVPPYLVERSGVKDGAQVTVQGYQVSDRYGWTGGDRNLVGLYVTQATIDGKDYDLSRYYGPGFGRRGGFGPGFCPGYGAGYGPGYGMMRGYGPGYGMMGRGYGEGPWGYGMMGQWDDDDR